MHDDGPEVRLCLFLTCIAIADQTPMQHLLIVPAWPARGASVFSPGLLTPRTTAVRTVQTTTTSLYDENFRGHHHVVYRSLSPCASNRGHPSCLQTCFIVKTTPGTLPIGVTLAHRMVCTQNFRLSASPLPGMYSLLARVQAARTQPGITWHAEKIRCKVGHTHRHTKHRESVRARRGDKVAIRSHGCLWSSADFVL